MLSFSRCCLRFILVFMHYLCFSVLCFNVDFRESFDANVEPFNTQIYKRELSQFFDKASYSFNGFEKTESIPVPFPNDICILHVEGVRYAASLHMNKNGVRHLAVFKMNNGRHDLLADISTPIATAMDCKEYGAKGYIALAFNLTTPAENARDGSPIFEITGDRLRAVQYFAASHMVFNYLRVTGNEFFLLQTFANTLDSPNLYCPFYKWSGSTFNKWGRIPCSNARRLEPFSIDHENFVAVANYADQDGRTTTYSEVYKYIQEQRKFQLFQKIRTSGAVDVKHFSVPVDVTKRQHFLVFGNSINSKRLAKKATTKREFRDLEADSVFYVFDKGQFVPYQRLPLYAVEQFLPIQNMDAEKFLLLVACGNQDTRIYNFNDWKFEESETQFTEGALGKGVANMRTFQENDNSYLVIANELTIANETNIFLPIFKQDEHANALRQQIIDWVKVNTQRLEQIDVEQLKENVQRKIVQKKGRKAPIIINDIPISNIQTVFTKSLAYPRLHLSSNYWKALTFANQALDVLQKELRPRQLEKRSVDETDDAEGHDHSAYTADRIHVKTLIVRDKLNARRVNGVDSQKPQLGSTIAKIVNVTGNYSELDYGAKGRQLVSEEIESKAEESEPTSVMDMKGVNEDSAEIFDVLNVTNLQISGKLNEYTWNILNNNTLKQSGLQFLKAPVTINNLVASTVLVSNDALNGRDLGQLISISGGNYVINQDIQFAAAVNAKNFLINERLNNIHVHEQKFDVLLRKSNATQVVQGPKKLENAKVIEPITMAGHMLGDHLSSMSPNRVIHEDLILTGNFTIASDVNISKWLNTTDMIISNDLSVGDVLSCGLLINETIEDVNLLFEQPFKVNDSLLSFVNVYDMQQLVKGNTDRVQLVAGEKLFNHGLEIRNGLSVVKYLNGVNIEELEQRLLLKHTNQTIAAPMHFGSIIAKGINGTSLTLSKRDLSEYLTRSKDQRIEGSLKVKKLYTPAINVHNLNTNGDIFNEPLSEIYRQKARSKPHPEIFRKGHKFHGSIYVKNLQTNATLNARKVEDIERELDQLNGNIKHIGNFNFNYDMNISRLSFDGRFNGIPAKDFGRCWLQKIGDQNFTEPQTLTTVGCEKGFLVEGTFNGYNTDDFITNTYWTNRNEYIEEAVFETAVEMHDTLQSHAVNGLNIPHDLIFRSSAQPQVMHANAFIRGDLHVNSAILNTSIVNGINLAAFDRYMTGFVYDTLHVSNANFTHLPHYKTLNGQELQATLDAVWLANENVDLRHHVEISKVSFEGLLDFRGPINNMNLKYLKENYFSLSRAQDITTEIIFESTLFLEENVTVNETIFHGPIMERHSKISFNFNEFVANTLKTSGSHEINAIWNIHDATLAGDLLNVRINNMTLTYDIVRTDTPITLNDLTATKRIVGQTAIDALYAISPISTINDVCVSHWINDTVYVYEDYTIRGVTTLNTVNMYGDLRVKGRINNISFDADTLLLRDRDQVVSGDVYIRNSFPNKQRILANNVERLNTQTVNGANVDQFFAQQVDLTSTKTTTTVHGHLVFKHPLLVTEFHGGSTDSDLKWKRDSEPPTANGRVESWDRLEKAVQTLKHSAAVSHSRLDYFDVLQTLNLNANAIISLTLQRNNTLVDVIGIEADVENGTQQLFFYWEAECQTFSPLDNELSNHQQLKLLLNIRKITMEKNVFLPMRDYRKLSSQVEYLNAHLATLEAEIQDYQYCFAISGEQMSARVYCLQMQHGALNIVDKAVVDSSNLQQVVALSNNTIALLYGDAVEIWQTNALPKATLRIPIMRTIHMAVGHRNNITYLAIVSAALETNIEHHSAIVIYSTTNAGNLVHLQNLHCIGAMEVAFTPLIESDDLLLHVLTSEQRQPLTTYQFKGVAGFEEILSASTLRNAHRFQIVKLHASKHHLIALKDKESLTFLKIVLKKF